MRATDNHKLGCTCFGNPDAQPLVITPGWATDHNFLLPFVELFKDYYLILVDMPGYGKSKDLARFATDLRHGANLILNTVPDNCILLSWSLSTLAAARACATDKEGKIKKFITLCGTPRFPADPYWPGFDYKYVLKCLNLFDEGKNLRNIKLFFKLQTQSHLLNKEQSAFLMDCYEKMGEIETQVLKEGLMNMAQTDYREGMYSLKIPCLHIFGGKDRLVKPELSKKLNLPPFHQCCVLENSAHTPFLTEPDLLKTVITSFIEKN